MELSRQEYPALLTSISPTQAVNLLNDRVTYIGKVNSDIANWLAERRRVEEIYVQGLKKLARLGGLSANYGVFQTPWQGLQNSIEALAESHDTLARRIEADVEKPLRDFTNKNREMQAVATMKGNLQALARDFDEAQKKSDKIQGKGSKADTSKLSSALSGVQEAGQQWESQAPFVFESLQALDESRVNLLRDALTQLLTHEVDLLERSRSAATATLELILNVNTSEEISAFVARNAEGGPSLQPLQRPVTGSQSARPITSAFGSLAPPIDDDESQEARSASPESKKKTNSNRGGGSMTGAFASLAPPDLDDRASEVSSISESVQTSSRAPPIPPSPQKKSTFGGLRRLGTVMGRRNKDPSSPKPEKPAPPERKVKTSRNPLRRNSTLSDMQRIPSPDASAVELGDSSAHPSNDVSGTALSRNTSIDQPDSRSRMQSQSNGNAELSALSESDGLTNGNASQLPVRQIRPPSTILEEGSPSALDEITRAQQEADATTDGAQHLKVDIRNNPISEEDTEAQNAAFSSVANALRASALPPARKQGTVRGRRDVRNTIFVPSGATPESVIATPNAAASLPSPLGQSIAEERSTDSQSIRSAHSLTSLGPGAPHRHPELSLPGLSASIIETVSTSFDNGQAVKSMVTGEIALAYNGQSVNGRETIRLDNFAVLLKVAPNPQFIEQVADRSGEYSLDLHAISKTQVGFKYQVHLEESALGTHSPVSLTPVWRIEPHQASVILNYKWNPTLSSTVDKVTLSNVVVVIQLENAKATSCMSKPVGTFSAERGQISWKLGQVTLEKSAPEQRVLARFATDGEAKAGIVEARWEINNENASELGSKLGLSVKADGSGKTDQTPDPFSDESFTDTTASGYKPVSIVRKLVSGRYLAN